MGATLDELNQPKNEIVRGIERIKNLVSANSQSLLSRRPALHFDEAQRFL